jgi:V/A-type H+/Na+-transporting ATPase subunit E
MGLEKVRDEVLAEAKKKASAAINAAEAESSAIVHAAEKTVRDKRVSGRQEAERLAGLLRKKALSSAALEGRKKLLQEKNKLMSKVFDEAKARLEHIDAKTRERHITSLLVQAKKEIDVALILCNEQDVKVLNGVKALAAPIAGGIIAESSDGKVRVDFSYETLMEQVRQQCMQDVAKILFSGKK